MGVNGLKVAFNGLTNCFHSIEPKTRGLIKKLKQPSLWRSLGREWGGPAVEIWQLGGDVIRMRPGTAEERCQTVCKPGSVHATA